MSRNRRIYRRNSPEAAARVIAALLAVTAAAWSLPLQAQQTPAAPRSAPTTIAPRDGVRPERCNGLFPAADRLAQDGSRPLFLKKRPMRACEKA